MPQFTFEEAQGQGNTFSFEEAKQGRIQKLNPTFGQPGYAEAMHREAVGPSLVDRALDFLGLTRLQPPQQLLPVQAVNTALQGAEQVAGPVLRPLANVVYDRFGMPRSEPGQSLIPPQTAQDLEALGEAGVRSVFNIPDRLHQQRLREMGLDVETGGSPIPQFAARTAGEVVRQGAETLTPGNVATMGASSVNPLLNKLILGGFLSQVVPELPEVVGQATAQPTPENIARTLLYSGGAKLMNEGMLRPEPVERGPVPTEPLNRLRAGTSEMPWIFRDRQFNLPDAPQPFQETPPLIGQRPLRVEQKVIQPRRFTFEEAQVVPPKAPVEPSGGEISFRGEGVPSAMQAKEMVPPFRGRVQMGLDPSELKERLRPYIDTLGGLVGRRGETHGDTLERNGISSKDIDHPDPRRGFVVVDDQGKPIVLPGKTTPLLTRKEAAVILGKGTADAGGADSADLPKFGEYRAMRSAGMSEAEIEQELSGGTKNAISELRTDSPVEAQAPGDISGVGEEIRQGAAAEGQIQKAPWGSTPTVEVIQKAIKLVGKDALKQEAEKQFRKTWGTSLDAFPEDQHTRSLFLEQVARDLVERKVDEEASQGTLQEAPKGQGLVGFTQKGANIKQLIGIYTGRGGKREAVIPGSIEKMHPDDLRQMYQQLESLHKERTKAGVATEKGQQALTQENTLWSEIRNRLFRVGLRQGENIAGFSGEELQQVKGELEQRLGQKQAPQVEQQLRQSLLKVNELISKEQPKQAQGGKLYGGLPIFDPELWGMSKEQVKAAKEKLEKVLAARGDKDAAKALGEASPNQFKGKSERAKAILNNPSAKPLHRQQELMNQPGEKLSLGDKARNLKNKVVEAARYTDKVISPPNVVFDMMDGGQGTYRGALMQNVKDVIDSDFNNETILRKQLKDPLSELIVKNKMGKAQSERIGVYLNTLQEGGRERMVQSGIDPRVINNIEKTITSAEREVAQAIREMYDTTGPLIQKVAKDVDKIDVNLIPNYFSWQREWRKYKPDADELATNPNMPKSGATVDDVLWPGLPVELGSRVVPGSTIGRVPKAKTPIKIDAFEIVDRYVRDATHYISMRKNLKEISEIVRSEDFEKTYGKMGQEFTLDYLNTVARQGRYKRTAVLDTLRRLTSRGVIAFRIPSQIVHLANIPLAQQRTGVVWWQKGLDEALSDEGVSFLRKNFAETFERGGGEPALQEVAEGQLGKRSAYQAVGKAGFWLQRRIDQLNAQATVLGLYMRRLKESGADPSAYNDLPVNQKFLAEARTLAQRAVASPIYKDVPLVMSKGGSLARTFFQFQNTFLDQWSNIRYDLAQAGLSRAIQGNPKLAMQMTAAIGAMLLVETSIKYGYSQALQAATGQKQKEDDTFQSKLWHETLRRVPGMGQLTTALVYGETGIPSIDVALQPIREGRKALKADDEATRTISGTRAIGAAAEALGVPGTSQALDIVTGLERGKFYKSHEQRLKGQTGQEPSEMDLGQRFISEFEYRSKQPRMSPAESAKAAERNIANEAKRGSELQAQLDKADRQWLQSRKLSLPGFDNKIKSGGTSVYLTDAETKRMSQLMLENYKAVMPILREQYDDLDEPEERQALFSEATKAARQLARDQMLEEMSNSKNESNQRKKFQLFK